MKGSALHHGAWLQRHCPRAWDQACVLFLLVTLIQGVGNAIKTEKEQDVGQKNPSDLREQQGARIQRCRVIVTPED